MCVDFVDINEVFPKECYRLTQINEMVDYTSGHALSSLTDVFSVYHQITLPESNRNKAALIVDAGVYAYKAMFGLKNARARY